MKMKKIKYKIHDATLGHVEVEGYACLSGVDVRFCVRKLRRGYWCADHFDTGLRLAKYGRTKELCAGANAIHLIDAIRSGLYIKKLREYEASK